MNKIRLFTLMAIVAAWQSPQSFAAPLNTQKDTPIASQTNSVQEINVEHGFQVSIGAKSSEFVWSSPVIVDVSIKNVADKSLILGIRNGRPDYRIEVKTKDGKVLPLTRYGQQRERGKGSSFATGPLDFAPGESAAASVVVSQIFDMTIPGEYLVQVYYSVSEPKDQLLLVAASKAFAIKVVDKASE